MGQSRAAADLSGDASWATYGVAITVSGAVTVGLGFLLAAQFPVFASVLVGVPAGLVGWMLVRRALAKTVGWSVAAPGPEGADEEPYGPQPAGSPASVGSDR